MPKGVAYSSVHDPQKLSFRWAWLTCALAVIGSTSTASAASPEVDARKGLAFARKGQCVDALPLLESAENARHRPETAVALADCYVKLGALLNARALYDVVSQEQPERSHSRADRNALAQAKKKLKSLDARIPTISFTFPTDYKNVVVTANGEAVENHSEPHPFDPNEDIVFVLSATGRKPRTETISLEEKERRVVPIELQLESPKVAPAAPEPKSFIGLGYRGYVIPGFLTNIFGEGGRTVVAPGAGASFTRAMGQLELTVGVEYVSLAMGPTPFKPKGTPDTEYEIIESDMQALQATVELRYNVPLDTKKRVRFRIGAGLGVGWTFMGNLYRTQAFPPFLLPGDPYTYLPCRGPNNPGGSFRYCNELDKDADHYGGYSEPSWFAGGVRPLVYPWIALPIVGLSFRPIPRIAIDVDVAPSIAGLMTSAGVRVGF